MNCHQIMSGFFELLSNSKTLEMKALQALQNLPQLLQNLDQLENDQYDTIADTIVDWCANNQPLGENLRIVALRAVRPKGGNPAHDALRVTNIDLPKLKIKIEKTIEENQTQKSELSQENTN